MISNNILESIFFCILIVGVFLFGAYMNSTYLSLPSTIQEKIKTDTKNNYRTTSNQIEYIINEYYKDK